MRLALFLLLAGMAAAQQPAATEQPSEPSSTPGKPAAEVRHDANSSSSRDSITDLSPPKDDLNHPGSDDEIEEATGIHEMKPWDPHKAMKDVEVGRYYATQKNYKAAISRFREALEYKPRDAEATFFLADSLEKSGALP